MAYQPLTMGSLIRSKAEKNKDRVFLHFYGQQITYREEDEISNRFANKFIEIGIKRGDKVAVMLGNCPEFIHTWFALGKMGGTIVPINTALKGDVLSYLINDSGAETIVTTHEFYEQIESVKDELKNIKRIILDIRGAPPDFKEPKEYIPLEELYKGSKHDPPTHEQVSPTDPVEIMYTSGTTGRPKGVEFPNMMLAIGDMFQGHLQYTSDDVLYTCLPLFHGNAQVATVATAIAADASVALGRRFSASRFWDEIRMYNATEFNTLGAMIPILMKQPERPDDADNPVRIVFDAGCPPDIWPKFEKRFNVEIWEWYGAVDSGVTFNLPVSKGGKLGSIGKPAPLYEVRIVDENGNECPPYVVGEIVTRGILPHMRGPKYTNPEITKEKVDEEGWTHTGDLGYRDEDGFLYFVGRKKDMIRIKGENIAPYEIEKVINAHPKVLECAAIAVPSELAEDEAKVCIVLKEGETMTPEEVWKWCEERLPYFMVPRYVEFKDSLPKTETNRVIKYKLKEEGITPTTFDRLKRGYKLKREIEKERRRSS